MYTLKSNNNTHVLLEKNDIKIELISKLTLYNTNVDSAPIDSNFIDVTEIKNKYDIFLLNLYFHNTDYGENKIFANCLYPTSLFDASPVESNYKSEGFMSAAYIASDSVTPGTALKYTVSLLKTGPNKILARCTNKDVGGSLYGIKL